MKVLLSAPRAGSSYAYEQIHEYNISLPNVFYIGVEEYLDPNQMSHLSLEEKIVFLDQEKSKGIHYTFKHHINYLGSYYKNWFKDFYKDNEIIILKRKNTWKWFLSFLFQDCVSWKTAAVMKNQEDYRTIIEQNWIDYDFYKSLDQFFDIKAQLDACTGDILYYEDLQHTSNKYKKLSTLVNYESMFTNIEDIRIKFRQKDKDYYEKTRFTYYS